jgi:transposase
MEEIRRLRREGLTISEIASLTGRDRKTVRKYLDETIARPVYRRQEARESKLAGHMSYLEGRLKEGVWNAVVLLRELREQGYTGGYTILKDWLAPQRAAARTVAVRRFETAPGEQAQVDWGSVGVQELEDGTRLSLSAFVMTLGHSRAMHAQICLDEQLPTLLKAHEAAFEALGGITRKVVYDNMRTVILGYDERGEPRWHPVLADFASYWGFKPRVCQPYRPQTKGKVERGIGYLKGNFLCGRRASSLEDLQSQLRAWLGQVANARIHGTTHRQVQEAWDDERPALQPVGVRKPYPFVPEVTRKVAPDCYVSYGTNRYSVPWSFAGREVHVRQVADHLEIVHGGATIARHPLATTRFHLQTVPAHHQDMPYGLSPVQRKSAPLVVAAGAPQVEVRSLQSYELLAAEGSFDADA